MLTLQVAARLRIPLASITTVMASLAVHLMALPGNHFCATSRSTATLYWAILLLLYAHLNLIDLMQVAFPHSTTVAERLDDQ